MRKLLSIQLTLLILISTTSIFAQTEKEFTPYGKPVVLVFANVNTTFNHDKSSKSFELTRAYLGYEYFFTKSLSSKVNIDVGDPGVGKLQMTAFIKNAYVMYKKDGLSARFGMIGVDEFNIQEKQWGYRYIYKSFQDAYNFGPSADLGAGVEYAPAKFISFDVSVLNGEGYKKIQSDSAFKTTVGLTLRPIQGLVLRGYYDYMKKNDAQTTVALFVGYSYKVFKTGFEYNIQKNNGMIYMHDLSGISAYASMQVAKKFTVFSRYDLLKSEPSSGETLPWNSNNDGQLFMAGFDYSPTPGIKIAPTYFGWSPYDKTKYFTTTIALNFEIKF